MICDWAARRGMLSRVEVLGFVDGNMSVDWIYNAGCRVINLLTKDLKTLYVSVEENVRPAFGRYSGCSPLCSWKRNGCQCISGRLEQRNQRFSRLCVWPGRWTERLRNKTFHASRHLGGTESVTGNRVHEEDEKRYPDLHFDFHAHNDYDLAVSNVLAAVLSGVKGLHTTINGLGERAGNAPLASVQAILKDHSMQSPISMKVV